MEAEFMRTETEDDGMDNIPEDFQCPISKELMMDPVTISTGMTYERKNIEKWLFAYKKKTCPATMQRVVDTRSDITPNHTLKRLIVSWMQLHVTKGNRQLESYECSKVSTTYRDEMMTLLNTIESSPFKITPLKKIRALLEMPSSGTIDDQMTIKAGFIRCGGVELVVDHVLVPGYNSYLMYQSDQMADAGEYFANFRACEEALGVLHQLLLFHQMPDREDDLIRSALRLLSRSESVKSIAIMLQKGSTESRYHAVCIFRMIARFDSSGESEHQWINSLIQNDHQEGIDLFKSLLELVSDDMSQSVESSSSPSSSSSSPSASSSSPSASSYALDLLIEIFGKGSKVGGSSSSLKKNIRLKAIEAGAVCVLVDLLPDSGHCNSRSRCEKILLLLKLLCECAEGRIAFVEHPMSIAAVSKKLLRVSSTATKIGVKILWLISKFQPKEKVLEDLLVYGSVKKLLALLHMDGRSSTKDKVIHILKSHANSWKRYPCFPFEFRDYMGLINS